MKRFLISGSAKFNNYYLFNRYVKEYLPKDAIVITCGGSGGTDLMSIEYCNRNNIPIEEYPVKSNDIESITSRNAQLMNYFSSAIIFDDGRDGTPKCLKDVIMQTSKSLIVIEIHENDNIDCNYKCTNTKLTDYLNKFRKNEYSIFNIADISSAILYNEDILKAILDSNESDYVKSDTIDIGAGFAYWMRHNERAYLKQRLKHEERSIQKKKYTPIEELAKIWTDKEHPAPVYTSDGLQILTDFESTVADEKSLWLEANDGQIIKNNIWQTREKLVEEQDNPINSFFETKDNSDTKLFRRNDEFETQPFRSGMWYVNAQTLK